MNELEEKKARNKAWLQFAAGGKKAENRTIVRNTGKCHKTEGENNGIDTEADKLRHGLR